MTLFAPIFMRGMGIDQPKSPPPAPVSLPERPAPSSPLRPDPTRDIWTEFEYWAVRQWPSFEDPTRRAIAGLVENEHEFDDLGGLTVKDLTNSGIKSGTAGRILKGCSLFKRDIKAADVLEGMSET